MAGQHLSSDVVVAVNSVRRLIESAGVAVGVTGAMKDETVVMRGVEPRNAFRVGTVNFPGETGSARGVHAQMLRLRTVQPADQLVVAGLGDLGCIITKKIPDPCESLAPGIARDQAAEITALGRPIIVRPHG